MGYHVYFGGSASCGASGQDPSGSDLSNASTGGTGGTGGATGMQDKAAKINQEENQDREKRNSPTRSARVRPPDQGATSLHYLHDS